MSRSWADVDLAAVAANAKALRAAAPGTELEASASHDALHAAGGGFLPIFLSLRFWVFWLMAFGMVGTILHYLQLAPLLVIPFVAAATGLASGLFATWSFRALARTATQSGSMTMVVVSSSITAGPSMRSPAPILLPS